MQQFLQPARLQADSNPGNPRGSTTVDADVAGVSGPDSSLALQVGHQHPVRVIRQRPGQRWRPIVNGLYVRDSVVVVFEPRLPDCYTPIASPG
jgi:hypothetical protein